MMYKPSWEDAPVWAKYLAMDEDGEWFWYETKPIIGTDMWNDRPGRYREANPINQEVDWKTTLETRP